MFDMGDFAAAFLTGVFDLLSPEKLIQRVLQRPRLQRHRIPASNTIIQVITFENIFASLNWKIFRIIIRLMLIFSTTLMHRRKQNKQSPFLYTAHIVCAVCSET